MNTNTRGTADALQAFDGRSLEDQNKPTQQCKSEVMQFLYCSNQGREDGNYRSCPLMTELFEIIPLRCVGWCITRNRSVALILTRGYD